MRRGLGLEWINQLLRDPTARIVAAARNKSADSLAQLAKEHGSDRLLTVSLDTTNEESAQVRPPWTCAQVLSTSVHEWAGICKGDFHSALPV